MPNPIFGKAALVVLAAFLIVSPLSGCGTSQGNEPDAAANQGGAAANPAPDNNAPAGDIPVMERFDQMKANAAGAADWIAFLTEHLADTTTEQADTIVRELLAFYETDLDRASEVFVSSDVQEALHSLEWPIAEQHLAELDNAQIRESVQAELANGYKLEMAEGMVYPVVDYGKLKPYGDRLSPPLKAYIDLLAMNSDKQWAADAALVISWDELAERGIAYENYLVNYLDAPETEKVRELYEARFLIPYLYGLNNTPIFDFDTFRLKDEVKASYEKTVKTYPDTITAQVVAGFLDVLEASDWQVFRNVQGQQTDVQDVKTYREGAWTQFLMRWDSKVHGP